MPERYEIVLVQWEGYYFESEIGMLTGLELSDILIHTQTITTWRRRTYVELFQKLGYSCNNRFVKFDRDTPYPCLMRCHKLKEKRHWYGFVYYDNQIYCFHAGIISWAEWNELYPNYRITSMLQVWI